MHGTDYPVQRRHRDVCFSIDNLLTDAPAFARIRTQTVPFLQCSESQTVITLTADGTILQQHVNTYVVQIEKKLIPPPKHTHRCCLAF